MKITKSAVDKLSPPKDRDHLLLQMELKNSSVIHLMKQDSNNNPNEATVANFATVQKEDR